MKKIALIVFALLLVACTAMANPFLVCDPQSGVVDYKITGAPWVTAPVPAQTDGSLKLDVATSQIGTTALSIQACDAWGQCSTAVPFDLSHPAAPTGPTGLRLTP